MSPLVLRLPVIVRSADRVEAGGLALGGGGFEIGAVLPVAELSAADVGLRVSPEAAPRFVDLALRKTFFGQGGGSYVGHGVHGIAAHTHFVMQMRAGRPS